MFLLEMPRKLRSVVDDQVVVSGQADGNRSLPVSSTIRADIAIAIPALISRLLL
jgi:hypothetical protein